MEVQSGVSEEEIIEIMRNYRENWKTAEKEKQPSKVIESSKNNRNNCDVSTLVSFLNKRGALKLEKRPREKWTNTTTYYKAKSSRNHVIGHFMENIILKWQRRWNDEDRGR